MPKNPTASISPPSLFDIFLILICSAIWASAFTFINIAVGEFKPIMVAFSRVSIGFVFLISYIAVLSFIKPNLKWPKGSKNWFLLCVVSLLYTAIPFSIISWGQQYISASLTSILMGASPLIGYVISHFATKDEKLTPLKFLALALGIVGILIAIDFDKAQNSENSLWGIIAIISALFCYSVSGMLTRKISSGSTECLSAIVLGLGTIFLIPALFISGQFPTDFSSISSDAIFAIIYLGLFPTGLAYLIRFYLIVKIGFTAFLTTIFFIPIFGVILSAWILDETITTNIYIALAFLVASLIITRVASKKAITKLEDNKTPELAK